MGLEQGWGALWEETELGSLLFTEHHAVLRAWSLVSPAELVGRGPSAQSLGGPAVGAPGTWSALQWGGDQHPEPGQPRSGEGVPMPGAWSALQSRG